MQSASNFVNGQIANNTFGGGVGDTVLGPGVLVLGILAVILIAMVRRKLLLGPLMFGLFLLPVGQTLVLGGFHLYVSRILIAVALIRAVTSRSSYEPLVGTGYNSIDTFFVSWAILRASAFVLRFHEIGAVINQVGSLWDILGGYFLMRFLIQNDSDVLRAIKILSAISAVLGLTTLYEKLYDVNVYGRLAATPIIPEIRNGSIRAQGPFHHAILAGTFGATLLPLFVWLWRSKKAKLLGPLGVLASTVITFASASSTPVSAYAAAVLAMCFWPLRRNMRMVRWGLVIGILALNFVMHAPVWYVLEHIDFAGGSAGQHRAELVDNFVRHFSDWWLVGTSDNAKWGFEMWDVGNQYVGEGETGGLATFICFLVMLYFAFKWIGIARQSSEGNRQNESYFWLLGAAFFSHCVAFLGISYFDQTRFSWYALLAVISVATAPAVRGKSLATTKPQLEEGAESFAVVGDDSRLGMSQRFLPMSLSSLRIKRAIDRR